MIAKTPETKQLACKGKSTLLIKKIFQYANQLSIPIISSPFILNLLSFSFNNNLPS